MYRLVFNLEGRFINYILGNNCARLIPISRQVLCRVLGVPDRLDWKACAQTDAEERADAQAFKQAFAAFDFTQT